MTFPQLYPLQLLDSGELLVTLRDFADYRPSSILLRSLTQRTSRALVPLSVGVLFVLDPRRVQRRMVEAARHEFGPREQATQGQPDGLLITTLSSGLDVAARTVT
jgi:hypothetical protein